MATRMQQRRGTATQWSTANPVLGAGEIGFETNTGKFKIGDGSTAWAGLNYYVDANSILGGISGTDLPAALDTLNELAAALGDDANYATTVTNALATKAPLASPTFTGTVSGITKSMVGLGNVDNTSDGNKPISTATQIALDLKANSANPNFTGTAALPSTTSIGSVTSTEISYLGGVTSAIQTQLDTKAPTASPTFTGTVSLPSTTAIGDVSSTELGYVNGVTSAIQTQIDAKQATITGGATTITATDLSASKALISNAQGKVAVSTVTDTELGYLSGVTSGIQAQIDGKLATSTASSTYAPLSGPTFTGTVTLPSTTSIGDVSSTEIGYLNNVTSAIQTQLDAKAPTANPTFTGTVSGVTKAHVGLGSVDDTSDANKPVSTATQTALDLKANLAGPTFTGTVTLPSTTSIGDVSSAELGHLDGVTSAIQTQLDSKLALAGGTMTGALTLSGAPTSDLHAATKLYVDNVAAGINFHEAVHAASTTNLATIYNNGTDGVGATLTADTNRAFSTLDGESVALGQRVLIKNQTDAKQNGIYTLTTVGSGSTPWVLTRATDADNSPAGEMKSGDFTFVQNGTVNASVGFINNSAANPIVIGTSNITYTEFNAAKTIVAGSGLTESTPGTLDIATGGVTSAMIADGTIVNGDISASAAIDQSKISGLSASLAAKANVADPTFTGTVTLSASGVAFTDGTQTREGVPSRTPISQQTAAYNLSTGGLSLRDNLIEISHTGGSAVQLTIPADSTTNFPIGTSIDVLRTNTGGVTIAGAAGVTVNGTPGLTLRAQWSSATLFKRAANTWVVMGDLTA